MLRLSYKNKVSQNLSQAMQFKRQGTRIQVLAYRGYDKEKKRAIVKMQGSIDGLSYAPSDGLIENLTAEEKIELQSFIKKERQSELKIKRQADCDQLALRIQAAVDSLQSGSAVIDATQATEIWNTIAALQKALKASGHKKAGKALLAEKTEPQSQAIYHINGVNYLFPPAANQMQSLQKGVHHESK